MSSSNQSPESYEEVEYEEEVEYVEEETEESEELAGQAVDQPPEAVSPVPALMLDECPETPKPAAHSQKLEAEAETDSPLQVSTPASEAHPEQSSAKTASPVVGGKPALGQDSSAPQPSSTSDNVPTPQVNNAAKPAEEQSEAHTTNTDASSPSPAASMSDLAQLEAQASKVARDVTQAAKDMSSKFTAAFGFGFGGGSGGAASVGAAGEASAPVATSSAAANETGAAAAALAANATAAVSKIAGGLGSWWNSLDIPTVIPKVRDELAERIAASSAPPSSDIQELFGLGPSESLVESFPCKLLQTYACSHNAFTPAIQMAFQGTLYITDRHTCFSVEERGKKIPCKLPHTTVVRATRQRPARKGDLSDILKIETSTPGQFACFKDFESGSALDSALALVEHLTSSD